jgi:hypothetical protein
LQLEHHLSLLQAMQQQMLLPEQKLGQLLLVSFM